MDMGMNDLSVRGSKSQFRVPTRSTSGNAYLVGFE